MPSIYLAVYPREEAMPWRQASHLFAILVDLLTNRSLDEIDPVEAFKNSEDRKSAGTDVKFIGAGAFFL